MTLNHGLDRTVPKRRHRRALGIGLGAVLLAGCSGGGGSVVLGTTTTSPPTSVTPVPTSSAPAGTGTTSPTSTSVPAVGTSPVGVVWDFAKQDDFRPQLERLQGGATWYELEWCQVQPDPSAAPNWARADKNVARAKAVGIEPMLRVRVGSCWATGGDVIPANRGGLGYSVSAPPADVGAYQAFVRSVVERYEPEGVHTYSIENEVNGEGFWQAPVADYEALVRAGAEAIRQADPQARVVDAGLSSTTWGGLMARQLLDEGRADEALALYNAYYERRFDRREKDFPRADDEASLREALATEKAASNAEFAAATFRLADDGVIDAFQLHFYEPWGNIPALLDYLDGELPAGMPVEVWEAGLFWPDFDGDQELVAGETSRLVYLLLGHGASEVIYLPMQSNSANTGDEVRFGLVDADFQPRAGFEVMARLAEFAKQGGGSWREVQGRDGLRAVVGTGPGGAQALVWAGGDPVRLQAPGVTISSLDGSTSGPAEGTEVGAGPVVATAAGEAALLAMLGAG